MEDSNVKAKEQQSQETAAVTPSMPNWIRRRYMVVAAVFLLVVLAAAVIVRPLDRRTDPKPQQAATPSSSDVIEATPEQLEQVRIETVREQVIDLDLQTTGKVGFNEDRMTPVFSPYAGRVLEVLVNKGDLVKTGQPLLVVESPDLVTAVNDLAEARAEAEKAKIALDSADKAAQRARNLNALEALAAKELQASESDLARAREDYRRALARIAAVRNHLTLFGKSASEIAQLEESVTDQTDRQIVIRAPLAGTIVERKVGPGQYIKSDAPEPLYLISDLSTVWVNVDIYEMYLPQVHVGAPVEITVAAYPERKFPARITAINPIVDAQTRTIHVRCLVPNASGLLKPEMFANIRISDAAKQKLPSIPSTAVLTEGSESFVLVEASPGRFRKQYVKSARDLQGYTVVTRGLRADDRVVTSGVLLLSNAFNRK